MAEPLYHHAVYALNRFQTYCKQNPDDDYHLEIHSNLSGNIMLEALPFEGTDSILMSFKTLEELSNWLFEHLD